MNRRKIIRLQDGISFPWPIEEMPTPTVEYISRQKLFENVKHRIKEVRLGTWGCGLAALVITLN